MNNTQRLDQIRKKIESELHCPLKDAATHLVFGKGNPNAAIMFIGEAPGEKEDKLGIPFVGAAGKQLDKLLRTIGLTLDDAYIANILKYRPPDNRNPTPEEIARHTPYLVEQIKTICPRVIITLGNFSTKFVLSGFSVQRMDLIPGITTLHGKSKDITVDGLSFTVIPMYHPAAMLYRPALRQIMETDFLEVATIVHPVMKRPMKASRKATQSDMKGFLEDNEK